MKADSDTAERLRRFIDFQKELKSMRAEGLRAFVASGVSDSLRERMDARIEAVNLLDSLGRSYRNYHLKGMPNEANSVYFEYLKALRVLDMQGQFFDLFKGLPPMEGEIFQIPGREQEIKKPEPEPEPDPDPEPEILVTKEPVEEQVEIPSTPKPKTLWADNWNFWVNLGATYNTVSFIDNFEPPASIEYNSYIEDGIGYSVQLGLARKIYGAFSFFVEVGVASQNFAYYSDFYDFNNNVSAYSRDEHEIMDLQAGAGLKIRMGRLDLRFAYLYTEALDAYSTFSGYDDNGGDFENEPVDLTTTEFFNLTRMAVMADIGLSLARKARSHRKFDLQLFVRPVLQLDDIYDLTDNPTFDQFSLTSFQIGLRFQY